MQPTNRTLIRSGLAQVVSTDEPANLFLSSIKEEADRIRQQKEERKSQRLMDEQEVANIQVSGDLRDHDDIENMINGLVSWEKEQLDKGVDPTSQAYRSERRRKITEVERGINTAKAWSDAYAKSEQRMRNTPYYQYEEGMNKLNELFSQPLYNPETGKFRDPSEVTKLFEDDTMHNYGQLLKDVLGQKERFKDVSVPRQEGYYTNQYEGSYDPRYWKLNPEGTGYEMVDRGQLTKAFWADFDSLPEWGKKAAQRDAQRLQSLDEAAGNEPKSREDYLVDAWAARVQESQKNQEPVYKSGRYTVPTSYSPRETAAEKARTADRQELDNMYADILAGNTQNVLNRFIPKLEKYNYHKPAVRVTDDGKVFVEYWKMEKLKGEFKPTLHRYETKPVDAENAAGVRNLLKEFTLDIEAAYEREGALEEENKSKKKSEGSVTLEDLN